MIVAFTTETRRHGERLKEFPKEKAEAPDFIGTVATIP
jgi:murein tripeptide amidase MpaA